MTYFGGQTMNDERINGKLSLIGRNNVIIISIVSAIFLVLRLVLNKSLNGNYHEIYLLSTSLLVLLIALIYKEKQSIVDERIEHNVLNIYKTGFWSIAASGFVFYYLNVYFNIENTTLFTTNIRANTSINLILIICLILSYINVRRNGLTYNYKTIENEKSVYYSSAFKKVLVIFLYFLAIGLIISIIQLFVKIYHPSYIGLLIAVSLSFFDFSVVYLIFSVFEKNRYDELLEKEAGQVRRISQNALFFFWLGFIFSLILSVTSILYNAFPISIFDEVTIAQVILQFIYLVLFMNQIVFIILAVVVHWMIYKSIKASRLKKPVFYVVFYIYIWINLIVSIILYINSIFSLLGSTILIQHLLGIDIQTYFSFMGTFNTVIYLIHLGINILVIIFLFMNHNKHVILYTLMVILSNVYRLVIPSVWLREMTNQLNDIFRYQIAISIIALAFTIFSNIVRIILIKSYVNTYDESNVLEEEIHYELT